MSLPAASVARVRLRARSAGSRDDLPGLARAVARQIEGAEPTIPGAPPAAVLVVRSLADPKPGALRRRSALPRPDPTWEGALRDRLGEAFRAAARPAREPVPTAAVAVAFADEAEMLGCFALDLARGLHHGRWWWRELLRRSSGGAPLPALLAREVDLLPAVFAVLAARGTATEVAGALAEPEAASLLDRMVRRHGPFPGGLGAVVDHGTGEDRVAPPPPPWRRWLPAGAAEPAGRARRALVGTALALHHAPTLARSPRFADALARWWRGTGDDATAAARPVAAPGPAGPEPSRRRAGAAEVAPDATADRPTPGRTPSAGAPADGSAEASLAAGAADPAAVPERSAVADAMPRSEHRDRPEVEVPGARPTDAPAPASGATEPPPIGEGEPVRNLAPPARSGSPTTAAPAPEAPPATMPWAGAETSLATRLAGAFYLVHLFVRTRPEVVPEELAEVEDVFGDDLAPGPWRLIELVTGGLLAGSPDGADADLETDGLWPALALLDGRDPREGRPASRAERTWLDSAVPRIGERLRDALGGADPVAHLLLAPGTIHLSPVHVDVVIPLEQVSLPARRAGLDRDPGWVPELGRVVLFHFE